MQTTSDLYKSITAGEYQTEVKVVVGGNTYTDDQIVRMVTHLDMFDTGPTIGGAVCGEIDLELLMPVADFPRMAKICPYIRVTDGTRVSEWLPKGVYYIDTRQNTQTVGNVNTITLHGYDAMLMLEQPLITEDAPAEWPKKDTAVVQLICAKIGVSQDSRNSYPTAYDIAYPGFQAAAMSCREVLQEIGVLYAGTWVFNDAGELRLIRLGDIPEDTSYLIDEYDNNITVGGVRLDVR